jgi:RNA recognition motif-containing protein
MKNIFVGNLPSSATENALRDLFSPLGEVQQVRIMTDRDTGKSRGFAFVEMLQDEDAAKAIAALNGKDFDGRALTINEARPKPARSGGGGYGGPRSGGGGGYGGNRSGGGGGHGGNRSSREPRW